MKRASFRSSRLVRRVVVAVAFTACTSVDSTDLKTAGMSATLSVSADGSGASKVSAALNVDTNDTDYVQLGSGDTLTVTAGSQTQTMVGSTFAGAATYSAAFEGEDAADTKYTIALNRTGDTSAPSSVVTLPAPPTISTPSSASYSRANDAIVISYASGSGGDPTSWTLGGSCIVQASGTLTGDPGTLTIAKGTLNSPNGDSATAGNCQLTLTITRTRAGTLDPAYQGGTISASQTRTVTVQSTP